MVTRDHLIAYLLHRMPEEARVALAEQWVGDPDLHEQLRMAEAELLDAYVRGETSTEDRRLIEAHLLGSEVQREKLAFAEALHGAMHQTMHQPGQGATYGATPAVRAASASGWRGLPLAAAAAVLLLAASSAWLLYRNITLSQQIAAIVSPPPVSMLPSTRPTRVEPPPSPLPALFAMTLRPNDQRGAANAAAEPALAVPAGVEIVRLDLELDPADRADAYTITLSTRGRTIWREEPITPASRVPFWVPAALLGPGRYEVAVTTQGQPVAFYQFHVDTN